MSEASNVSTMPCGHPASAVIQGAEGTAYCGDCEREAWEHEEWERQNHEREMEEEAHWRSLHDPGFDGYYSDGAIQARRDAGRE